MYHLLILDLQRHYTVAEELALPPREAVLSYPVFTALEKWRSEAAKSHSAPKEFISTFQDGKRSMGSQGEKNQQKQISAEAVSDDK